MGSGSSEGGAAPSLLGKEASCGGGSSSAWGGAARSAPSPGLIKGVNEELRRCALAAVGGGGRVHRVGVVWHAKESVPLSLPHSTKLARTAGLTGVSSVVTEASPRLPLSERVVGGGRLVIDSPWPRSCTPSTLLDESRRRPGSVAGGSMEGLLAE